MNRREAIKRAAAYLTGAAIAGATAYVAAPILLGRIGEPQPEKSWIDLVSQLARSGKETVEVDRVFLAASVNRLNDIQMPVTIETEPGKSRVYDISFGVMGSEPVIALRDAVSGEWEAVAKPKGSALTRKEICDYFTPEGSQPSPETPHKRRYQPSQSARVLYA